MTDCMSIAAFFHFLELLGPIWQQVSDTMVVINTTGVGDVFWQLNETQTKYCVLPSETA